MGLAVLPARLKKEMANLEEYILEGKDIRSNEDIEKHADWVEEWMGNYSFNKDNIHDIIQDEISKVFVKVLECAGVYKRTEDGMEAFMRFVNSLQSTSQFMRAVHTRVFRSLIIKRIMRIETKVRKRQQ